MAVSCVNAVEHGADFFSDRLSEFRRSKFQSGLNQPSFAWRYGAAVPHAEPRPGDVVLIRLDRPLAARTRTLFGERGIALQRVEAP